MSSPADRRVRAPDRDNVCPTCAGPKTPQAFLCKPCRYDEQRDATYYERRTCPDCGGPKKDGSARCRACANELLRGVPCSSGRVQPDDHPWKKAA